MKIKLDKVEYTLKFNMGFIRRLHKEYNIDLVSGVSDMSGEKYFDLIEGIVYCGINDEGVSKEQVKTYVEDLHPTKASEIVNGLMLWMTTPPEVADNKPKTEVGKAKKTTFHA